MSFNFERINFLYYRILAEEQAWQKYFAAAGVVPFTVIYEEFVAAHEETTRALLQYLNIPAAEEVKVRPPKLKKMADDLSEEWVKRYYEIKAERPEDSFRIHWLLAEVVTGA